MESAIITLSVLLNLFQCYQIFIFFKFIICHHYEIRPFVIRYTIISLMELGILGYIRSYIQQKTLSDTEEITILSSYSIYIVIKFSLILFQSFVQKRIQGYQKFKVYYFLVKLFKTFLSMNSLMTVFTDRNKIHNVQEKYLLMIGVPVFLYIFFIGMNQLILYLRRKGVMKTSMKVVSPLCRKSKML